MTVLVSQDTLDGGANSDWLYYTAGEDTLTGGTDNDIYDFTAATDNDATIVLGSNFGHDAIMGSASLGSGLITNKLRLLRE